MKEKQRNVFFMMFHEYPKVAYIGAGAFFFSFLCVIFKCVPGLNVPLEWMRILGEFLLNIAISLIAAEIFFIFQVVVPNNKKNQTMKHLMKKSICESVVIPLNNLGLEIKLIIHLTEIYEMSNIPDSATYKTREKAKAAFRNNLQLIKDSVDNSILWFYDYLPDEILALLDEIKYSSLIDRVTMFNDFSELEKELEEIEPLLVRLKEFAIDDGANYRDKMLSSYYLSETLSNNLNVLTEAFSLYEKESKNL